MNLYFAVVYFFFRLFLFKLTMLSASLQSTWDVPQNKNNRQQRLKYGNSSGYDFHNNDLTDNNGVTAKRNSSFKGNQYSGESSSNYSELPNLRVPHQVFETLCC